MTDLAYLQNLEQLVITTSDKILDRYFQNTTAQIKSDGSIVTEADLQMQKALSSALNNLSPEFNMLGEEMNPRQQQKIINSGQGYWCLDPLDGTNNFHHGVPLFSISLALIVDQVINIGVVYDPVRKEIFSALKGAGLRINGEHVTKPRQPDELKHCLASVDFKRLKPDAKERLLRKMPFKSQRNVGSCALEWAWLAAGRTQLLLHGGEKFWDYAAGSLLVEESQGFSCTYNRETVFNNSLENRPVIAASNASLQRQWYSFLVD